MKKLHCLGFLSLIVFLYGCVSFNAAGEVQSGRLALLTGRPNVALAHFQRAAEINPQVDYALSPIEQSIWTYIGRAYYDAGNLAEARKTLERASSLSKDDFMAKLYLGLTLTKIGDRERGLSGIESGLIGMRNWLDNMKDYDLDGRFWDSTGELASKIREQLASISGKEFSWPELIANGEWLGQQMEEEIDRARTLKRREQRKIKDWGMLVDFQTWGFKRSILSRRSGVSKTAEVAETQDRKGSNRNKNNSIPVPTTILNSGLAPALSVTIGCQLISSS